MEKFYGRRARTYNPLGSWINMIDRSPFDVTFHELEDASEEFSAHDGSASTFWAA